ncbi:alpha/beta fold hydrolase [Streptomyces sp. NPDC001941]|uniref:alpha/beta hydrolase n=1 Tax=Streptomyces sp. NPDC001941 TaxID=3154659 RepID=UPI0033238DFB
MTTRHEPAPPAPGALTVHRRGAPTPRAAVLFLHGGRADSHAPSRPWHLAALRMRPFVRAAARTTADDVLLATVRYRLRGWNGGDADALRDTRRALEELSRRFGPVPTVLVGHSMGGRAALRAADAPQVAGVVALAPWCPDGEPVAQLRGKGVLVLHGDRDRITDPTASADLVRRARTAGARARTVRVPGGDHAMLRDAAHWHTTAAEAVRDFLAEAGPPAGDPPR